MPFVPIEEKPQPGGFVPLAANEQSAAPKGFTPLEAEPERPSMLKMLALENPATAAVEAGLNLASSGAALPVAGLAGLGIAAGNALGLTEKTGAETVEKVSEAMTYQPRGGMGKAAAGVIAYPFEKLNEGATWAGNKTLAATDSPGAATAVHTLIEGVAPMVAGPALKKGGAAVKEQIAGKPEPIAETAPQSAQATNAAPDVADVARAPESAAALHSESQQRGFVPLEQADAQPGARPLKDANVLDAVDQRRGFVPIEEQAANSREGVTNREAIQPADTAVDQGLQMMRVVNADSTPPRGFIPVEQAETGYLKPSQQMGIDPKTGPLSAVAAAAVDRGVAQQVAGRQLLADQVARPEVTALAARDRTAAAGQAWAAMMPEDRQSLVRNAGLPEAFARNMPATEWPRLSETVRSRLADVMPETAFMRAREAAPSVEQARTAAGEQAAETQYSFAPGANYTGFIDDAAPPVTRTTAAGRAAPIRREDVIVPFARELGASIYTGRIKQKSVLGFFRRGNEEVRIKRHADLEVTAHEMAHLIDARVPALSREWRSNTVLREELKTVSYDKSSVSEGWAESVRLWMTQPDVLQQRAPKVFDWIEGFVSSDKKYGPPMRKAQEGMTGWFAQDAVDRARSKIGDHRPLSDAMNGALDRFRQSVSDDLHGVYRMERELQGGKLEPVGAYESARLSRASASIADGAVRFGYPVKNADGSFSYKGKGLQQILEPVGKNLDDALLYFVGRSAQELSLQGRERLFTKGEIRGMLALETPEARKAFAEYQAWNRGVLDFAEAQGVLNPETRRKWKRVEYLPFHRVQQPGGLKGKPGDWQGIQALTGGTENIKDVLGNMVGNAAQLIDVAVKNEARQKIAALASKPGGGKFMAKINPGSRPVKVGGDQVMKEMFDRYGIMVDGDAPAFFEFMIHGQPPAGGNVVAVLKDGKPVWYEVADPILFRSLQSIDRPPMPWLTRWLGLPKRVGQATITMTPDFMMANIARDTIMASIMSRAGFRPVIDSLNGMNLRMRNDPIYKDFIANGGGLSSIFTDEAKVRAKLEKFYHDQGIDARAVLDTPEKLISAIETIADAFEVSSRIGEYRRAIERGEHPRHAAYLGREVSADFAMRGDSKALGFMYDTVIFMKAAVVSWDRLARGVAHDPNRAMIGAKAGMLAMASAGLYMLNRDNPRYQDLPDWQKDSYWHFFVPMPDGTEKHLLYPKIWEVGSLASMAERTTGTLLDDDPNGLGKDFARIMSHTFNLNMMPQIVAPLYEQATNRNSFTKTPIDTPGMENVQPFLRSKPNTSETMKALGMATRDLPESLQVPPARAEALLRGYLNTWAMYGLMLSDQAFFGDKLPEMRTDQMPVVRRFYQDEPARGTKFESQFYDMLGEAKRLQGTLRELDRQGRPDIADQKEQSPLAGESKPLERANKNLQNLNAEMKAVRRADELTPAEKRQRLDALTVERNQLLKDAVQAAKAAQANR
jgi:hypothetical protein